MAGGLYPHRRRYFQARLLHANGSACFARGKPVEMIDDFMDVHDITILVMQVEQIDFV